MFKWVVSISLSCYELPFEFDTAHDAEEFAKTVMSKMQAYDKDKDGNPRIARVSINAYLVDKEDE